MTRTSLMLLTAVAAIAALPLQAMAATTTLGTAGNFAVLAGTTITNTNQSVINGGDVGLYSGSSITGFAASGANSVSGSFTQHITDSTAQQAKADLTTAYNAAAALSPTTNLSGTNLGGLTLTPGVYFFSSSAQLTGTLTLNYQGNANAVFVFQIGSTLTTASNASVVTTNIGGGTTGCGVFWQVGSSATIGTGTSFEGHILALTSITLASGATMAGSALARNGAVTMDANTITNANCGADINSAGTTAVPLPTSAAMGLGLLLPLAFLLARRRANARRASA
jgi:type VI secretion system secreted protein VgrG